MLRNVPRNPGPGSEPCTASSNPGHLGRVCVSLVRVRVRPTWLIPGNWAWTQGKPVPDHFPYGSVLYTRNPRRVRGRQQEKDFPTWVPAHEDRKICLPWGDWWSARAQRWPRSQVAWEPRSVVSSPRASSLAPPPPPFQPHGALLPSPSSSLPEHISSKPGEFLWPSCPPAWTHVSAIEAQGEKVGSEPTPPLPTAPGSPAWGRPSAQLSPEVQPGTRVGADQVAPPVTHAPDTHAVTSGFPCPKPPEPPGPSCPDCPWDQLPA